jgi:hypothetical protein
MPMIFGNKPEGTQAPGDDKLAFFESYYEKIAAK